MSVYLLDVNVLIALAWPSHVHHGPAHRWFAQARQAGWATCPTTQCGFVRISSNPSIIAEAVSPRHAVELLRRMASLSGHRFWPDDLPLADAPAFRGGHVQGHRQITDAYLLGLAARNDGRLATLDARLVTLAVGDQSRVELVPT